jgi:hypothetical protein
MRCIERMVRREMRPPSDSKSPRPVSRRGLDCCDDEYMPVICPTAQDFFERRGFILAPRIYKSPRPVFRARANFCDDKHMPVICPTEQVVFRRRRAITISSASIIPDLFCAGPMLHVRNGSSFVPTSTAPEESNRRLARVIQNSPWLDTA